jgi:hypothetical protein
LRDRKARHQSTHKANHWEGNEGEQEQGKKQTCPETQPSSRSQTKPTPQRNPTPETKPTLQHRTTHKKQPTTSGTQRNQLCGTTGCRTIYSDEPSRGPPSAVHISSRMMRALEPAGSSMGNLETSGRREHARGVGAPHHSKVPENVGETAPVHTGSLRPREAPCATSRMKSILQSQKRPKDSEEMGRKV